MSYGWSTIAGGAEPEDVDTAYVSDGFFSLLGVAPAAGRLFLPEEYGRGAERVMVLGYGFWQRQFGGAPDAIGRRLTLSGDTCTVVGIMPAGFEEPFSTKVFLPLGARRDAIPTDRRNRRAGVFARLKEGVTLDQARREMSVISDRLALAYPATNTDVEVVVQPWRERMTGRFRTMIGLLLGAVAFVLLIGCVNIANLLMARAASRQKEIAIRLALGARRSRLIRQLLTESFVLAVLGGAAGVMLAYWSVPVLNNLYAFEGPFSLDPGVLAATAVLVGVTALLFGSVPALVLARLGTSQVLKDRTAQAAGAQSRRFRAALVVAELALSLVLLYGAALLMRSFHHYTSLDKGFNPRNVLSMAVNVYKERYPRTGTRWSTSDGRSWSSSSASPVTSPLPWPPRSASAAANSRRRRRGPGRPPRCPHSIRSPSAPITSGSCRSGSCGDGPSPGRRGNGARTSSSSAKNSRNISGRERTRSARP